MTDIETRLRKALRAEAARVQPGLLRELRVPARRRRGSWGRSGSVLRPRMLPWLAPVASALAVVAVIAGVRLAVDSRPAVAHRAAPAVTAAAPAVPVPPYYVAANLHTQAKAWVYDSATAQVLGKVGVARQLPIAIAAAADDRTFAIVFQDLYRPALTTFMRLTLSADGHPASFQRLPVNLPAGARFETDPSIALSPDGQTLAVAVVAQKTEIELISLRTGATTRTWVATSVGSISDLSWARGGQALAFLAVGQGGPPNDSPGQVRVLNVSRPPGGLMTSSTPVRLRTAGGQVQSMLVTDSGAQVVAWVRMPSHPANTGRGTLVLAQFSTRTGQRLQVFSRLYTLDGIVGYGVVYSADPSGQHILFFSQGYHSTKTKPRVYGVIGPPGSTPSPSTLTETPVPSLVQTTYFGRLDNGRVTVLPSPAQDPTEFGAW